MSIPSTMDSADLENRCHAMRHELKAWEKLFASQHNGRKAGRDDIKANPAISQKYKEYGRIRDLLAGKAAPQTPSKATRMRKSTADVDRTPRARAPTTTPRKRKIADENDSVAGEEEISILLSPHGPAMIGPTPQRDGIVLGLFDLLPAETPSKRRAVLGDAVPNIIKTPSKGHNREESEGSFESRGRVEKTPMSSSKRFLLDRFVTPRKRKLDDAGTPTSGLKGFSTPSFLRRDNVLVAVNEEDEETPRPAPWKRRGLGRSLSSMIQSMKKQEEDRLDEEAEIMRELEMEAEGISVPKKQKMPEILVEDSQAAMPLGPDGAGASDDDSDKDDADNGQNQNGRPRKVWKKRGQKRQTRRVIMRPSFVKPPPPAAAQAVESDSETENPPVENVPTTGVSISKTAGSDQEFSEDDDASDYASDHSHTPKQRKTQPKRHEPECKTQPTDKAEKEGPVKAAARKVKATAHANFRRLKIKSSTGAKGGKGRFGRRR